MARYVKYPKSLSPTSGYNPAGFRRAVDITEKVEKN